MILEIVFTVLRSIFAFTVLMAVLRCMGNKSISEMTFFNFGVTLVIGTLAATVGTGADISFPTSLTVLLTFSALGVLSGYLHLHPYLNKVLNSEPIVLIDNGEIIKKNMRKARLAVTDLTGLLREKSYFSVSDVKYAILERNGQLSVLPKAGKAPLTPSDMHLQPPDRDLSRELVLEGRFYPAQMPAAGLDQDRFLNELKARGILDIRKVYYAALDENGNLYMTDGSGGAAKGREIE